tara:strand:- start:10984 stop:11460 length:477 start_codon:yes stop_codon:yes gene_type:complete
MAFTLVSIGHAKELTFEQFQESCENPAAYGSQNPPAKIKLLCHDVYNAWEPVESGIVKLSESRMISSELFSDKYHVSTDSYDIAVPERNAVCPRLREVVHTATIEIGKTCADVAGEDVTLEDLCREALDSAIAENPDLVETEASGRMFSVCGDATQKP